MYNERPPAGAMPSFDTMPTLSDENIADVLHWLLAFVDAFEDHYADPLSRWRKQRYDELHQDDDDSQLPLPNLLPLDEPF